LTKVGTKEEFKEQWTKWCKCFDDNDVNSINSQITRMLCDYSVWNLINGSKQYIEKDSDGVPLANVALYNSINKWFFETQMIAVRRLIDEYGIEGNRGVNSIMSVLKDMIENVEYLTRENIFELRKLQYDYAELNEAEQKWLSEHDGSTGAFRQIPSELDFAPSVELHRLINILSKTSETRREKSDTVDVKFLNQLKDELSEQCQKFKTFVDKYCAHAATEESRNGINADDLEVTVSEYKEAHKLLCKYANFIQVLLMDRSNRFLPIPPPNLFLYWGRPIFQGGDIKLLKEHWKQYEDEVSQWRSMSFDELKRKMDAVSNG